VFIGIDPGQSGGIACIEVYKSDGAINTQLTPMPSTEVDIWEVIWGFYETHGRRHSLTHGMYSVCAVIEHVHAMPKQGVSSTFKFGVGYGGLRMALIAASIPFEEVTPRTWQKALGVVVRKKTETKTQFKNRLKAKAQQLFPRESITLKTADALLIAEYCRRKQLGLL
jgi:hypothetical protein